MHKRLSRNKPLVGDGCFNNFNFTNANFVLHNFAYRIQFFG